MERYQSRLDIVAYVNAYNAGMSVILEGCLTHIFMCIKLTLNGLYKRAHIPMLCYNEVSIKSSTAKYGDET